MIEDHAVKQYRQFPEGIALLLEDFVEQNHQQGNRLDEQEQKIKDAQKRANWKAGVTHLRSDAGI